MVTTPHEGRFVLDFATIDLGRDTVERVMLVDTVTGMATDIPDPAGRQLLDIVDAWGTESATVAAVGS